MHELRFQSSGVRFGCRHEIVYPFLHPFAGFRQVRDTCGGSASRNVYDSGRPRQDGALSIVEQPRTSLIQQLNIAFWNGFAVSLTEKMPRHETVHAFAAVAVVGMGLPEHFDEACLVAMAEQSVESLGPAARSPCAADGKNVVVIPCNIISGRGNQARDFEPFHCAEQSRQLRIRAMRAGVFQPVAEFQDRGGPSGSKPDPFLSSPVSR